MLNCQSAFDASAQAELIVVVQSPTSRVRGFSWVSSRSCTASPLSPRPVLSLSKGRSAPDSRQVSPGVGRLRHLRRCRRQSGAYRFSLCRPQHRLASGGGSKHCPQLMTVASLPLLNRERGAIIGTRRMQICVRFFQT